MSKFGRISWNNNDFVYVFTIFIDGITSLRSLALWRVRRNTENSVCLYDSLDHSKDKKKDSQKE